jgi:pilus assembly protein CpaC
MNYVELNNEYEKTFNFEWRPLAQDSSTIKYDSALGELSANLIATVSSLLPKLVTARSHGHARILKQETLIVKDRAEQPGAIESSIDFYARNVNEKGEASLQPISIQNVTKVKAARIPGSDSIELGIQISLNSLLGTNQGAPIIAKNSLQTQVTIKNGESAALGGYAVDQALAGYNREPTRSVQGIGQTSGGTTPLFNLQRSKKFQRDKQQYVIFVTPEILRTASAGTEDITRKFRLNAGER